MSKISYRGPVKPVNKDESLEVKRARLEKLRAQGYHLAADRVLKEIQDHD